MRLCVCVIELQMRATRGRGWSISSVAPPVFFLLAERKQHRRQGGGEGAGVVWYMGKLRTRAFWKGMVHWDQLSVIKSCSSANVVGSGILDPFSDFF